MPLVLLSTLPLLCVSKMQVSSFHHCLLICSLITRRTNVEPPQGSFADFSLSLPPLPPSLSSLPLSSSLHGAPIIAAVLFRHNRPHWPCNGYAELFLFPPQGRVQIENGALSIAALNLSDSGMYQCVAENKHGIIYSSAQLMVLGKNCIPPSAFILLICLCVWSSPKIKKKKKNPAACLLKLSSAISLRTHLMSLWAPPAEIWIWWSVSFYFQWFSPYWFGYYKRISLQHRALLSHVDGVLILFAKLWWLPPDPVQWEIRSCLDSYDDTWGSKWWLTTVIIAGRGPEWGGGFLCATAGRQVDL